MRESEREAILRRALARPNRRRGKRRRRRTAPLGDLAPALWLLGLGVAILALCALSVLLGVP